MCLKIDPCLNLLKLYKFKVFKQKISNQLNRIIYQPFTEIICCFFFCLDLIKDSFSRRDPTVFQADTYSFRNLNHPCFLLRTTPFSFLGSSA